MGGRAARQALRAAPIPEDQKPVRPGLSSGRYQPLSQEQVLRIHEAAIETLETIGFANSLPSCVELVTAAGGSLTSDGRLLMPRVLVEESLEKAAKNITLYAQDPRFDLDLTDSRTYFGTAGAAVHVVDTVKREYRESTAQDLYDAARIVDQMEHIHFFQRSMVLRDIEDPAEMDFNTCYAAVAGTRKHVGTSFVDPAHAHQAIDMLEMIAGGEQAWRERPFVSLSCCFVVPPMRFAEDACRVLEVCVERGMPILLLAAGQAGATSPASLAGAVVQEVAEVLGGFVYVNLLKPGHPAIFGTWRSEE
ncbi:MAG: trimethylamine methyltransferase family protein, partial [Arenicellales bacterium]